MKTKLRPITMLGLIVLPACSSQLPLASIAPMPEEPTLADLAGSVIVVFPPPPARVEVVPAAPSKTSCVWLDGQWSYKNQDYEWIPGVWVNRPPGCAFAKSRFWWEYAGGGPARLRYRIGRWVIPAPPYTECPAPAPCDMGL